MYSAVLVDVSAVVPLETELLLDEEEVELASEEGSS
jgi:hypothetical protein